MRTYLEIYFAFNIFMASNAFAYKWMSSHEKWEYFSAIAYSVYMLLFAVFHYAISLFLVLLIVIYKLIDRGDKIRFYYLYYFTKRYKNMSDETLSKVNRWAYLHQKDTPQDKMWRKGMEMINKRHNYTYKAETDN